MSSRKLLFTAIFGVLELISGRFSDESSLCQFQRFNRDLTRSPSGEMPDTVVACHMTMEPPVVKLNLNTSLVQVFPNAFGSDRAPFMQFRFEGKGPVEVSAEIRCPREKPRVIQRHVFTVYQCINFYREKVLKSGSEQELKCLDTFKSSAANYTWQLNPESVAEVGPSPDSVYFPDFNSTSEGLYSCHLHHDSPAYVSIVSKYHLRVMAPPKAVSKVVSSDWWRYGNSTNIQLTWMDWNGKLEGWLLHTELQWDAIGTGLGDSLNHTHPTGLTKFVFGDLLDPKHSYVVKITPVTPYGRAETFHQFIPSLSLDRNKVINRN